VLNSNEIVSKMYPSKNDYVRRIKAEMTIVF